MNNPRPVCEHQQPTRLRVRSVRAGEIMALLR